jgi:hypothetical protein
VGQSQLVVQTTEVGGRQCPMRQLRPPVQLASVVQETRQVASMQSEPGAQSPAVLQVPEGRGRQRPAWQDCPEAQSASTVQPKRHLELRHQAPWPQSAL